MEKRKYRISLTIHETGYMEISADSEEEALQKVGEAIEKGQVAWSNIRVTDVTAKLLPALSEKASESREER